MLSTLRVGRGQGSFEEGDGTMSSTSYKDRSVSRRLRYPLALLLAVALALAGTPALSAEDDERAQSEWQSTDPSAEEAAGRLDAQQRLQTEDLDAGILSAPEVAAEPDEIVVDGGMTQPVFSYEDAIRETVHVPGAVSSQDGDETDVLTVDIIRPAASEGELDVPTIIVPSPYYQSPGRGRAGETKPPSGASPHVVAGGEHFAATLMTGSVDVSGETGPLVDCGLGLSVDDCPDDADGAIALVERGAATFASKALNAVEAGAVGVVVYNSAPGSFTGTLGGTAVPVPVLGISGTDGAALLDVMDEGTVEATLDEIAPEIDFFPLYYDNYFVPRGYAVALLDLAGTRGSTGCLDIGGPAEIENSAKLVEWLNGSGVAHDADGNEVDADWSNGLSSMVGKSWDGTVANGVAALGTEGLATIVPITAISSWDKYFWHNGARYSGHSPLSLADAIRNVPANQCSEVRGELVEGHTNPDPASDFWAGRDYIPDAGNVDASVFVVHGLNDYNVKPNNYGEWWEALAEHDVPRKIWLSQVAHEKAFDFRRDEWLVTINRWFDHWLHDVDNGVMDEPMADVEYAPDQWATYDTWPGGTHTNLRLGQPEDADDPRPGALSLNRRNLDPASQTFTETRQHHNTAAQNGFDDRDDRLVFMTDELNEAVRISGTSMEVSLRATIDGPDASLSAYLVDYGEAERTNWPFSGGILDLNTVSCFGQGTDVDTGCYRDVERRTRTRDYEVVARGWANASYITGQDTFDPDESYRLTWDIMADDYTFEAGHRIGVVITGVDSSAVSFTGTSSDVEVHLNGSHVHLPVVGGARALRNATD